MQIWCNLIFLMKGTFCSGTRLGFGGGVADVDGSIFTKRSVWKMQILLIGAVASLTRKLCLENFYSPAAETYAEPTSNISWPSKKKSLDGVGSHFYVFVGRKQVFWAHSKVVNVTSVQDFLCDFHANFSVVETGFFVMSKFLWRLSRLEIWIWPQFVTTSLTNRNRYWMACHKSMCVKRSMLQHEQGRK